MIGLLSDLFNIPILGNPRLNSKMNICPLLQLLTKLISNKIGTWYVHVYLYGRAEKYLGVSFFTPKKKKNTLTTKIE